MLALDSGGGYRPSVAIPIGMPTSATTILPSIKAARDGSDVEPYRKANRPGGGRSAQLGVTTPEPPGMLTPDT
jgi:hypothetical protein